MSSLLRTCSGVLWCFRGAGGSGASPSSSSYAQPAEEASVQRAAMYVMDAFDCVEREHGAEAVASFAARHRYRVQQACRPLVQVLSLLLVVLTFFEPPDWYQRASEHRREVCPSWRQLYPPLPVLNALELCMLLVLGADVVLQYRTRASWRLVTVRQWINSLLVVVSVVDLVASWFTSADSFRVAPVLRCGFVFVHFRPVWNQLLLVCRILPDFTRIVVLVAVYVFFFAWFGTVLFDRDSQESRQYFPNLGEGMWQLFLLLTTSNWPDMMVPAYVDNRWSSFFFIIFELVGLYFFMNLVLAVVYKAYNDMRTDLQSSSEHAHKENLRKAFDVLDMHNQTYLEVGIIDKLIVELNTYYTTLRYIPQDVKQHVIARLDKNNDRRIDRDEFVLFFEAMDTDTVYEECYVPFVQEWWPHIAESTWYRKFAAAICSNWFELGVDALLLVNAVLVAVQTRNQLFGPSTWDPTTSSSSTSSVSPTMETSTHDDDPGAASADDDDVDTSDMSYSLEAVETAFSLLYVVEMLVKILVHGLHGYWRNWRNRFDGIITIVGFVATVLVYTPNSFDDPRLIRYVIMIRLLRLIRLIIAIPEYRIIGSTFIKILPPAFTLVAVLACVMYAFAVIGIQLYGGKIAMDPKSEHYLEIQKMTYGTQNYWTTNFNDMPSAMVTLFQLLVVSNWGFMVEAFVVVTSVYARIFFSLFYLLSVLICLNIVVAFILNGFVSEWTLLNAASQEASIEAAIETDSVLSTDLYDRRDKALGGYQLNS